LYAAAWYQKAIDTWRKVLAREPRHRTGHIGMQNSRAGSAIALAHEGKVLEATRLVDSVAVETDVAAETWFNLAVACALCSQAATGDRMLSNDQRRSQVERHAARAMEFLQRAVQQGFTGADQLKSTRGLDSLCGREDFRKLLAEVISKAK
jgi:hypothetical protein